MTEHMRPIVMLFGGHVLPCLALVQTDRVDEFDPGADEFAIFLIFDPGYFHISISDTEQRPCQMACPRVSAKNVSKTRHFAGYIWHSKSKRHTTILRHLLVPIQLVSPSLDTIKKPVTIRPKIDSGRARETKETLPKNVLRPESP